MTLDLSSLRHYHVFAALAFAVSSAWAQEISLDEYRAARGRIEAEYKESDAACSRLARNLQDVCREDAKGKQKIAGAELEFNRSGKPADAAKLALAKADSTYAVAREKCDHRSGRDKDLCLKEAKTARIKAVADAQADRKIDEARRGAAEEKRGADYGLAKEKCDSLAGDGKAACLAEARSRYGKS